MTFSYNWLQSFFKTTTRPPHPPTFGGPLKLPKPAKLAELLTAKAFEVSEVKEFGKDWVLDIDVRPNRAGDCFSHLGIAREISAITGLKYIGDTYANSYANLRLEEDKKLKAKDFVSVEVKNEEACPRYTARVIIDVKVKPSPKWLTNRLKVCGLRPINNIVDIVNYVMLETGQPLHAFDGEKLEGKKIIVRFAKKGEKIVTLDEQKFNLCSDVLVIADAKKPIAIAGIKGGKPPEIDRKTKIIVLESANFDSRIIRKGSKKLNLRTDASLRFEHGIDPNLTEFAITRACNLIQKIAGGKVAQGLVDFYPKKVFPKRIKLDFEHVEKLLGIKISKKEIKSILKRLGFKLIEVGPMTISVTVPTFRLDILIQEDLIEEIGRIYGYEKIPSVLPTVSLIPPKRNLDIFWEDSVKNNLKEAGFTEVYNYSFINEEDGKLFGITSPNLIEVENPVSLEQKYLRPSLIPNLLKNVQTNQKIFQDIKIFELGKIFQKPNKEKRMLTGLMLGNAFYQVKGLIDLLLNKLGISNIWYDEFKATPEESRAAIWHPKKCAEIKVNHEEIGFLGEISPRILEDLKISMRLVIFDFDFEKLTKLASEEHEYRPISRFPAAIRDLAVLVPSETGVEEVLNKIEASGGPLIRDIDLFDIYEGEELPEDKKNLAFHIIFQSKTRTLSSKEIDEIQNKIIKAIEEEPEWQVRR
ncbi:MAG: phenylalanine--tRNA ligase subunit beta [Candidatus Nealsonbacteria bacterium CG_4_9_14_0_2_um_filter_37_38]|uniref:Phenylalanine--tRNA ligase beta subunit n=1 Tax=Candidatus Nealsonbacteria bacterium CG_4_10_14_0_8_um_filter_37_14 TaxID=1974684 RepID=A0A2M7R5P9_9BACT|nr:MAG: phenylalanine--tRNA ligase subunit beta [Candidatus Nealsonbacteria bacterium CG11_big_fil_rev_8_21_14_0_20_37_68]PIW92115.1 MAG: phenylalanine--tRNA ligase subunit beta [Candidatus Nealsonbacteria bacterium CG_4_8_14_3_um_filter_37_23]PIY88741.1 MAG: phenylalanine--tRNA ligase subunit beta [Candidatus Nealsonbacteria bacterium CG_4_10_14_0_8_um_filter_37_14]PJC51360.1 MAG: phenylalanine--tRNA ligase subunit beta [Candidatus Nealsonbacteria bacterium CG_4_9_14_0_2_um_filter_37_38]